MSAIQTVLKLILQIRVMISGSRLTKPLVQVVKVWQSIALPLFRGFPILTKLVINNAGTIGYQIILQEIKKRYIATHTRYLYLHLSANI